MKPVKLSRRKFVLLFASAAASLAASCSTPAQPTPAQPSPAAATEPPPQPTAAPAATAPPASEFQEAPMLAELVSQGQLPPLAERLPKVPKVANEMPPSQLEVEVGQYGGTLRTITSSVNTDTDVFCMCNEPLINTPGILGEEVTPNICESYEVSPDQKEFTFKLREGLRWSDGEPASTEDVRFAYEDVLLNPDLTKAFPQWLRSANKFDGEPGKVTIVDDLTFKITFAEPYGGFLLVLAIQGWRNYLEILKPSHFFKKLHKEYAEEADLNELIEAEGVEDWIQLFSQKNITSLAGNMTNKNNLGVPTLFPWVLKTLTPQVATFERNPYYFKVDAAGNQLPYIDEIQSFYVADVEVIDLKNMAGECDFARSNPKLVKMPLYKENEAKGGFTMRLGRLHATVIDIFLNLTYKDPVWRQVVQDKRFRQALNMAINRDEIIDAIWYGFASPSTIVPGDYDPDGANGLLDEMGMDERDGDGFRLGPDGKTFVIPFETGAQRADQIPTLELLVQFWQNVGIRTTVKKIDGALWTQRTQAGEHQATMFWSHTPLWYMGDLGQPYWATQWNLWFTSGGTQGEEPPDDVKAFLSKVSAISAVPPEEGRQVYEEVKQMMAENVYYFVPVERLMQPLLAGNKLGNVSSSEDAFAIATNFAGEQFFLRA